MSLKRLAVALLLLFLSACSFAFVVRPDRVAFVATDNELQTSEPRPTPEIFVTATLIPTAVLPQHFSCVTRTYSNVRKSPSLTGLIAGSVPVGKTITWYNRSGAGAVEYDTRGNMWYAISYGVLDGFILSTLLDCRQP